MSVALPESLDAWRMVSARRTFEGARALSRFSRLREALEVAGVDSVDGECRYVLQFDRDALGVAYLEIRAEAVLPLICQRTLDPFELPVHIEQRLGLIAREDQEAGLPEGYEPILVGADGFIDARALLEDELILAIPVVPSKPGTEAIELDVGADGEDLQPVEEQPTQRPFALLAALRKH